MGLFERMVNEALKAMKDTAASLPTGYKMVATVDWVELGEYSGEMPAPKIEIVITKL